MVKKSHCNATVVIFLTCCISLQACADKLQCKRMQSVYDTMLKGRVFQKHNATNVLTCGQLGNSKIRCQSVNYVVNRHSCQLNNRTKKARLEDYVQDADRVYLTRPSERGTKWTLVLLARLELDNTEWSRTNENRVFRCLWRHRRPLVTETNMAEYGSCCKLREVYSSINRIAIAERASLEEVDRPAPYSAIFVSVTRGRRWRQRHRKTRFLFGFTSPFVI